MKALVAFPSTAIFGQQAALAFQEIDALEAFLTTFAFFPSGPAGRVLGQLPGALSRRVLSVLGRRAVSELPREKVETNPTWEIVRTLAAKSGMSTQGVDRIWDHLSRTFTRNAAERVPRGGAVYAYEYTALEAFAAAENVGAAKILDFPSLNSRQFEHLQRAQREAYPELRSPNDSYFESLFETRQKRRDDEMERADVIITNSSVTRASHIAAGADPHRTFAVPYGAPPALGVPPLPADVQSPLKVVWAGTFSIRKGAHLFMDAWRKTIKSGEATADVYGAVAVPERLCSPAPAGMHFHGSVVRAKLFAAFESADVLVFPTLSDGFGMVVTEAFAKALPVITTDQAGASDLVNDGINGRVIPAGNTQAIVDALHWCLDNRQQLGSMKGAALQTARAWQWTDYRRALINAVSTGVTRAGYEPLLPHVSTMSQSALHP
jgi:glycosyltransferase involved in cell wall biosynthesis